MGDSDINASFPVHLFIKIIISWNIKITISKRSWPHCLDTLSKLKKLNFFMHIHNVDKKFHKIGAIFQDNILYFFSTIFHRLLKNLRMKLCENRSATIISNEKLLFLTFHITRGFLATEVPNSKILPIVFHFKYVMTQVYEKYHKNGDKSKQCELLNF